MSAPTGNQFWKLRSKHGRDLLFGTPELLWDAAREYFEATDSRKWIKKDWVGKDATEVERESTPPYTLGGLCLYLDCSREWWTKFRAEKREDFLPIVTRIEEIIYSQKFEGAAVGAFNASIIARDLGLREQSDINLNDQRKEIGDVFQGALEQNIISDATDKTKI